MPTWVITGANRGLGLEFVTQLSARNETLIFAATRSLESDLSELEALEKTHGNVRIMQCDTSSPDSVAKFTADVKKQVQKVDFLINNAGINSVPAQNALHLEASDLQEQMAVNVLGPAKVVAGLVDVLSKGSVVINMTSGLASMQKTSEMIPTKCCTYSLSKAALNMLTLHQAHELGPKNEGGRSVSVVCIDPGWVRTAMGGEGATMEKDVSIRAMLKRIESLTIAESGKFFAFSGDEVPW